MRHIDPQEKKIIRALIKNPRMSDNQIGKSTRVPIRTVSRKRKKLEEEGVINYFVRVNTDMDGIKRFMAKHLYIIKFRTGITKETIINDVKKNPRVKGRFPEIICSSQVAEVDGHLALFMTLEGTSDNEIVENFNGVIVPSFQESFGKDAIMKIHTMRILEDVRFFHNYILKVNIEKGKIKKDWPDDLIFVV